MSVTTSSQKSLERINALVAARRAELVAAGLWVDERDAAPAFMCETCEDKGYVRPDVPFGHSLFGKLIDCPAPGCEAAAANRQRRVEMRLKSAAVPDKYKELSFTTWYSLPVTQRAGKELAAAAAWCFAASAPGCAFSMAEAAVTAGQSSAGYDTEDRSWLVLQGDLGTGKTGLAAAIVHELTWNGHSIFFYRLQEMFKDIQRGYSDGTSDSTLTAVQTAPALVLDEFNVPVGADGKASQDKQRLLEEIIRYRTSRALPTVITCNLDQAALTKMWGERTIDVVAEAAHWIVLTGQKIRRGAKSTRSF
jgi:DNA replication protein DnaC